MKRPDGREPDQFRQIKITKNFLAHPIASVLIEMGGTKVLCAVSVENKVPSWMYRQKVAGGWITLCSGCTGEDCDQRTDV